MIPPKAVLFDVGNVLLRLKTPAFLAAVEAACPTLPAADMDRELKLPGGWHQRYERGQAGFDHFFSRLRRQYGLAMERSAFLALWQDYFEAHPPMEALARRLKGSLRLWALSNTNPEHMESIRRFPVFSLLEGAVASHEIGFRKPERAAFAAALKRMGLEADEVFFIDDLAENVAAAKAAGLRAYCYRFDDAGLAEALRSEGIGA